MPARTITPLTVEQANKIVCESISAVAPDVEDELDSLGPTTDVFEEFELDSMDHANVMTQLWERTGIAIAEKNYATMRSTSAIAEFLAVTSQESK